MKHTKRHNTPAHVFKMQLSTGAAFFTTTQSIPAARAINIPPALHRALGVMRQHYPDMRISVLMPILRQHLEETGVINVPLARSQYRRAIRYPVR